MFKNLDSVVIYVKKIARAKRFYLDKLGFVLDYDDGNYVSLKINKNDRARIALNIKDESNNAGNQTIVFKCERN